jgi:hypothetical protein
MPEQVFIFQQISGKYRLAKCSEGHILLCNFSHLSWDLCENPFIFNYAEFGFRNARTDTTAQFKRKRIDARAMRHVWQEEG